MDAQDEGCEPESLASSSNLVNNNIQRPIFSSSSSSLSSVPEGFDERTTDYLTTPAVRNNDAVRDGNANAREEVDDGAKADDTKEANDEERTGNEDVAGKNVNDQRSARAAPSGPSGPSGSSAAATSSQEAGKQYDSGLDGEADLTDKSIVGNLTHSERQTAAEAETRTSTPEAATSQAIAPRNDVYLEEDYYTAYELPQRHRFVPRGGGFRSLPHNPQEQHRAHGYWVFATHGEGRSDWYAQLQWNFTSPEEVLKAYRSGNYPDTHDVNLVWIPGTQDSFRQVGVATVAEHVQAIQALRRGQGMPLLGAGQTPTYMALRADADANLFLNYPLLFFQNPSLRGEWRDWVRRNPDRPEKDQLPMPSGEWMRAADRDVGAPARLNYVVTPTRDSSDPGDFTSFVYGQASWSEENLPGITYQHRITERDEAPYHWKDPPAKCDAQGRPITDPNDSKIPILDYSLLPDRISRKVEPWRLDAWRRSQPEIPWSQILARMPSGNRPRTNTLQNRLTRWRLEAKVFTWARTQASITREEANIREGLLPALEPWQVDTNTTRGSTVGFVNPRCSRGYMNHNWIAYGPDATSSIRNPKREASPIETGAERKRLHETANPAGKANRAREPGTRTRPAENHAMTPGNGLINLPVPTHHTVHSMPLTFSIGPMSARRELNPSLRDPASPISTPYFHGNSELNEGHGDRRITEAEQPSRERYSLGIQEQPRVGGTSKPAQTLGGSPLTRNSSATNAFGTWTGDSRGYHALYPQPQLSGNTYHLRPSSGVARSRPQVQPGQQFTGSLQDTRSYATGIQPNLARYTSNRQAQLSFPGSARPSSQPTIASAARSTGLFQPQQPSTRSAEGIRPQISHAAHDTPRHGTNLRQEPAIDLALIPPCECRAYGGIHYRGCRFEYPYQRCSICLGTPNHKASCPLIACPVCGLPRHQHLYRFPCSDVAICRQCNGIDHTTDECLMHLF